MEGATAVTSFSQRRGANLPGFTLPHPSPHEVPRSHLDSYAHHHAQQSRPPAPSYYTPSSTPQQPHFPQYTAQPSPTHHQSPSTGPPPVPRGLPSAVGGHHGPAPIAPPTPYRPYSDYGGVPGGPIMSNMGNPGGQMRMVHGVGVGGHHNTGYTGYDCMYSRQQPPQQERPFKCDQCPQSFNRNHDLKRHKRIHLAVKPFPCTHCDKSFSRKDALKRHLLVKNCGSASRTDGPSVKRDPDSDGDRRTHPSSHAGPSMGTM